jgi:hypothetical protein
MQGSTASPSEVPFDSFGDAPFLARDVDLELLVGRSVVASIASVRDDAGEARADLGFPVRQDRCERMAVIGISGQRLHMGDELASDAAADICGQRADLGLIALAPSDVVR